MVISVSGLGSGLDIEALVTGLVNAERVPAESRFSRNENRLDTELSAFGRLRNSLASLRDAAETLKNPTFFSAMAGTSSDDASVGITVDRTAASGDYQVAVSQLARSQSLASTVNYASLTEVVGEGELVIEFGTPQYAGTDPDKYTSFAADAAKTLTLDISAANGNNTLETLRDAINNEEAGVTASIVADGASYRLLLTSDETGVANSIQLSVTDTGDGDSTNNSGLSALAYNSTTQNVLQAAEARDALFSVNGLDLSSADNTVEGVIQGVELSLSKVTTADTTISIGADTDAVVSAVETFVEAFNSYRALMKDLTSYDSTTETAGTLNGDFTTRSLDSAMRSILGNTVSGLTGSIRSFADIGIDIDRYGDMTFDSEDFLSAFRSDPDAVEGLFAETSYNGVAVSGIGSQIDTLLDNYLNSGGLLDNRESTIQKALEEIEDGRAVLERRMTSLEATLRERFNAMDALVGQINSTGDFISQQLAALNNRSDN